MASDISSSQRRRSARSTWRKRLSLVAMGFILGTANATAGSPFGSTSPLMPRIPMRPPEKPRPRRQNDGVVTFPMSQNIDRSHQIRKRQFRSEVGGYYTEPDCCGGNYGVDLYVGEPPQKVSAFINTITSALWMWSACEEGINGTLCRLGGSYRPEFSSTSKKVQHDPTFSIQAAIGDIVGYYVTDLVRIGYEDSPPLTTYEFGVVNPDLRFSVDSMAGLGLSLSTDNRGGIVDYMYYTGMVNRKLFGLALDIKSKQGDLIVGGLDRRKYAGQLQRLPLVSWAALLSIRVDAVTMIAPNAEEVAFTDPFWDMCIVDVSSSMVTVPPTVFDQWFRQIFTAEFRRQENIYVPLDVDCAFANMPGGLGIDVGGRHYVVPFNLLVRNRAGSALCYFAVTYDSKCILGEPFLEAVYTTVDMDERAIYIAKHVDCGSEIIDTAGQDLSQIMGRCTGREGGVTLADEMPYKF